MTDIIIRDAAREDMSKIVQMIQDLADYEKFPDGPQLTAEDLIRDGFDCNPPYFFALVAESTLEQRLVGYAICNRSYSSWVARAMYVEDFYVEPQLRGRKIGHKIFKEICKKARDENVARLTWQVLVDNDIAVKFYEAHGAHDQCKAEKRTVYKMDKNDILAIANSPE